MDKHTVDERRQTTHDTDGSRQREERPTRREDGNPERHQAHKQGMTSHAQKEADVRGTLPRDNPASQPEQGAFGRETGRGNGPGGGDEENQARGSRGGSGGGPREHGGDGAASNKQE